MEICTGQTYNTVWQFSPFASFQDEQLKRSSERAAHLVKDHTELGYKDQLKTLKLPPPHCRRKGGDMPEVYEIFLPLVRVTLKLLTLSQMTTEVTAARYKSKSISLMSAGNPCVFGWWKTGVFSLRKW